MITEISSKDKLIRFECNKVDSSDGKLTIIKEEDDKNNFSSKPIKIPVIIAVFKEWDSYKVIDERAELEKLSDNEILEKKRLLRLEWLKRHPEDRII